MSSPAGTNSHAPAPVPDHVRDRLIARMAVWGPAAKDAGGWSGAVVSAFRFVDLQLENVGYSEDGLVVPNKDSQATLISEIDVFDGMLNLKGSVHGGCFATMLDVHSSMSVLALSTKDMFWFAGLSSEISIRYIAPAVRGDTIRLVSKTVKVGRNTALAETRMYRKSDNKLLVVGFHTKANTNGKHMNVDRVTPKL